MCGEKGQRSKRKELKAKNLKYQYVIVIDGYFLRRFRVEDW